jgi:hypothetical protein
VLFVAGEYIFHRNLYFLRREVPSQCSSRKELCSRRR